MTDSTKTPRSPRQSPRTRKDSAQKGPASVAAPVLASETASSPDGIPSTRTTLSIRGARTHNLKNVSIDLPKNRLIVFSGVSGSGKSSLAFDTIYAEGQRRYVESLSAYARQFLSRMARPDVERITGLAPAVAIQQQQLTRNPRSTVGTTSEVYDYLRLLYARIGVTRCKRCDRVVRKETPRSVWEDVRSLPEGTRLYILFPLNEETRDRRTESYLALRDRGFYRVVEEGSKEVLDLNESFDRALDLDVPLVLADRLAVRDDDRTVTRFAEAIESAFINGEGVALVQEVESGAVHRYSTRYECAECGIRYEEPHPRLFSFNNPVGACPECEGFGRAIGIDMDLVIPDRSRSLQAGAILPFTTPKHSHYAKTLLSVAKEAKLDVRKPVAQLTSAEWEVVMKGFGSYIGIDGFFKEVEEQTYKIYYRVLLARYRGYTACPRCNGSRLRTSAMQVFVHNRSIPNVVTMTIAEANAWFGSLQLTDHEHAVAERILEEIAKRLRYLDDVGLGYLRLDRLSHTLSGGEAQRINLATAIGSSLVGALYVLDEPSIGLHPRDTERLVRILHSLRSIGNTVIVVEHDPDIIRAADLLVEMGPKAGEHGGAVVAAGSIEQMAADERSLTGAWLSGRRSLPARHRRGHTNREIILRGVTENNLKNIDVAFPLGMLTVVTGVSGSGKSTLVHDVLYPAVARATGQVIAGSKRLRSVEGAEAVGGVQMIDQSPIGRSPRSNPATYVKAFDAIRDLFSLTPVARARGWKPGFFSFNVPGGRCEACQGEGIVKVEMQFLADIELTCEACRGLRYRGEVLDATFKGKSIVDVLEMTVDEALELFAGEKTIIRRLGALRDVGLGYLRLGQSATTLSGGEAQRVKLATNLVTPEAEHTLFIFDEPTTGLHFEDVATLLRAFDSLIDAGHSLIVIEHNLEVIRAADWIVDLGPEGGNAGGDVVATGTPETVARNTRSYTGGYLRQMMQREG